MAAQANALTLKSLATELDAATESGDMARTERAEESLSEALRANRYGGTVTAENLTPSNISELLGLAVGWDDEELIEICGKALVRDAEARKDAAGALNEARWHGENP